MNKVYYCPICHTEQSKARIREISGISCCKLCEKFVRAMQSDYLFWLTPEQLIGRKSLNPRFPGANLGLLRSVVKDINLNGVFTTENEILKALQAIRTKLYLKLEAEIRQRERYQFLTDILNMIDQLYGYRSLQSKEYAESKAILLQDYAAINIEIHKFVGTIGKALERIVEFTLSHEVSSSYSKVNRQGLFWLMELGTEIVLVNQSIEELVSLWHRANLKIDKQGWNWKLVEEDQKIYDHLMQKWSQDDVIHEKQAFGSGEELTYEQYVDALAKIGDISDISKIDGQSVLGYDAEEFIVNINGAHYKHFGHKYSDKLIALSTLVKLPKIKDRDWIFEDEIITFLDEKLDFSTQVTKSILSSLCLDGELIRNEDANPFEFRRIFRLIRRPLPRIKIGNRVAYYISVWFIYRSMMNIEAEYYSGSHPELQDTNIERTIRQLNQKYADYFVKERVAPILKNNGFVVDCHVKNIGQHDLRKKCGEIDILAFDKDHSTIIVGECKHAVKKELHVSQIRQEISNFNRPVKGYADKLRKKTKWVDEHKHEVLSHLKCITTSENINCLAMFVTTYYCPASLFIKDILFFTEAELDNWCRKRGGKLN